MTSIVIAIE